MSAHDEAAKEAMEASRQLWRKHDRDALVEKLLSFGVALGWPTAVIVALLFSGLGAAHVTWSLVAVLNVAWSCFILRAGIDWPTDTKGRAHDIERLLPTSGDDAHPDDKWARYVCQTQGVSAELAVGELVRSVTASLGWSVAAAVLLATSGPHLEYALFPTMFAGGFAGQGLYTVYKAEQRRAELVKLHREVLVRVQRALGR